MKRKRILGIGAGVSAAAATVAAFFLHPGKGRARRQAVRRSGEALARRSANVAALVGSSRRHPNGAPELRSRVEDALIQALGGDGLALRVVVDDDTVSVRGEVATLEQISRASQAIERVRGDAEVVNLVRLRTSPATRTAAG